MRCLVISPVPTVPATQGNAVNMARLNDCLQAAGYHIHMVYSAMEGMDADNMEAMRRQWDTLDVIPFRGIFEQPGNWGYSLDAWFDPAVGEHVARVCDEWHFDIALIHYVWMSAVCDYMPAELPKLIYTHDRFGDRHAMLARACIAPTWYSISTADEALGLARADRLIATQESEAAYFRSIVDRPVHVLGSLQALRIRPPSTRDEKPLRAGYIGSGNPGNRLSIRELLAAIDRTPGLTNGDFELLLAGPISLLAEFSRPYVISLGVVDQPHDVYRCVNLMLNPSTGGSGLKIKSVESLAAGMPLVATVDSMVGLPVEHPAHQCQDAKEMAAILFDLVQGQGLASLIAASHCSIESYTDRQLQEFSSLFSSPSTINGNGSLQPVIG